MLGVIAALVTVVDKSVAIAILSVKALATTLGINTLVVITLFTCTAVRIRATLYAICVATTITIVFALACFRCSSIALRILVLIAMTPGLV